MTRTVASRLGVVLGLVVAVPGPAQAQRGQREVIERVVAVVNDEAIWLSDLRRRALPFLEQALAAPTEMERQVRVDQLYGQMLDHLIDEALIQDAAEKMQVRVTSEDVERAIENVRRQSDLGEDEFWNAVRAQGFTEHQYREDVRRQLLRLKVLNTRARGRVNITEEDVRERYDQMVRQSNAGTCARVSMIKVDLPPDPSATDVARVRREVEELVSELTPGNFAERGGIDLGEVCGGMRPEFQQAIAGLRAGEISDPVRVENGFFVFLLHERVRGGGGVPPYEQLENELYRQMLEEAMARQEEIFIEELRREAVIDRRL